MTLTGGSMAKDALRACGLFRRLYDLQFRDQEPALAARL